MATQDLLTTGEVAAMAGVHRTTVHHWARDGKLQAAQVANGFRLFAVADVEALLAGRAAEAAS
jgi:excisionase family DNA binding protein